MATSGRIETGRYNNTNHYVQWQLAGQSVSGNYSDVNWQAGINMSATSYWYSNAIRIDGGNVDSQGIGNGTWSNISGTGDRQLRSGTVRIYHNNDGGKSFGAYINGWLYGGGNKTASGSWELPWIARGATFSSTKSDYSETNPMVIGINNPANGYVRVFIRKNTGADDADTWIARNIGRYSGSYTFVPTTAELNVLHAAHPNENVFGTRVVMRTYTDSGYSNLLGDAVGFNSNFWVGNANPVFTDYTYSDTNATTAGITGNNQLLIQGKSTIAAVVSAANKMIAQKYATNVSYTASIDGAVRTENYSASADVTLPLGAVTGSGEKTLAVRANDSRGNNTTVNKAVTVIPYATPQLVVTATRLNGFEATTTLKISGSFSRITVAGTDKNEITPTTLKYRLKQDGGSWGSWVTKAFTAGVGVFSTVDTLLSLVNSSQFDIEVNVSDKLETASAIVSVDRGIPIFMVSDNRAAVGVNRMPEAGRSLDVTGAIYSDDKKVPTMGDIKEKIYQVTLGNGTNASFTAQVTGLAGKYRFLEFEVTERMMNATPTQNGFEITLNGRTAANDYSQLRSYLYSSSPGYEAAATRASVTPRGNMIQASDTAFTKGNIMKIPGITLIESQAFNRRRGFMFTDAHLLYDDTLDSVRFFFPTNTYETNGITVTVWGYN